MLSLAGTLQVISSLILCKCSLLSSEVPKELTSKTREVPKENLETLAKSKCAAAPYRFNHAVLATLQNLTFMFTLKDLPGTKMRTFALDNYFINETLRIKLS